MTFESHDIVRTAELIIIISPTRAIHFFRVRDFFKLLFKAEETKLNKNTRERARKGEGVSFP